jgi:hypothetical protein
MVREQKVLVPLGYGSQPVSLSRGSALYSKGKLPFASDSWMVKDVYVIDIKPKDPKYPQGRKRIFIDKENGHTAYLTVVWDRPGKPWKLFFADNYIKKTPDGDTFVAGSGNFEIDTQFGMAVYYNGNLAYNMGGWDYDDMTPSALVKRGR